MKPRLTTPFPGLQRWLLGLAVLSIPFIILISRPGGPHGLLYLRLTLTEFLLAPVVLLSPMKLRLRGIFTPIMALGLTLCLSIACAALAHLSRSALVETARWTATFGVGYWTVRHGLRTRLVRAQWLAAILALAGVLAALLAWGQMIAGLPGYFIRGGFVNAHGYGFFLTLSFPFVAWMTGRVLWQRPRLAMASAIGITILFSATLRDTGLLAAFTLAALLSFGFRLPGLTKWFLLPVCILIFCFHAVFHHDDFLRFLSPYEITELNATFVHNYFLTYPQMGGGLHVGGKRAITLYPPAAPVRWDQPKLPTPTFDCSVIKQRWAEWLAALRMWSEHPFWGVGPGNYQNGIADFYAPLPKLNTAEPDTQNGWLVLGASIGLVGVFALMLTLLIGVVSGLATAVRPSSASTREALASACAGVLIAGGMTPITQTGVWISIAVLLALLDHTVGRHLPDSLLHLATRRVRWSQGVLIAWMLGALAILLPQMGERLTNHKVYLWREAEHALRITRPMVVQPDPEASGGAMLAIARWAGAGWRGESGAATYDFEIPEAGRYTLWARVRWLDGCGNSFFLRVGDALRQVLGNDAEFGSWHWIKAGPFRLNKCRTPIEISNREDGVALDKLLLTGDPDFTPEGRWEIVFSQDLSEDPLRGWIAESKDAWFVKHGRNDRGRYLDYRDEPREARLLLADGLKEDFRLDCRFTLTDTRGDLRLISLYQDPGNFLYLNLNSSRANLVRIRNGKPEVLTSTTLSSPLTLKENIPAQQLTVYFRNGVITAQLDGRPLLECLDRRLTAGRCGFSSFRGGVRVRSFTLRPVEKIYYLYDAANATPEVIRQAVIQAGGPHWSNIGIDLALTTATLPPPIKFNIDPMSEQWIEARLGREACEFYSIQSGQVEEKQEIPMAVMTQKWPPARLGLRAFDRELTLLLEGHEAGHVVFSKASPLRGGVEVPARGVRRIEIKGLRRFYDGFGGCDGNNSASWEPHGGRWQVMHNAEGEIEECFGQLSNGTALALTGEPSWENYETRCLVRSSSEGSMGLVYHYQDTDNFDAVRWFSVRSTLSRTGRLQLVRRRSGRETVCVQAGPGYEKDHWYELRVARTPEGEAVLVDGRQVLCTSDSELKCGRIGLACDNNPGTYFDNVQVDFL